VGKLLGDGAGAFLALLSTIPLAVWCVAFGAATPFQLGLVYINLVSTTIFGGALGLLHPLDSGGTKGGESATQGRGSARGFVVLALIFLPQLLINTPAIANSWAAPVLGLFLPAFQIYGLFHHNVFQEGWPIFGVNIPYVFVTPVVHMSITALVFHIMRRRIVYLQNATLNKPMAYLVLAILDAAAVGMLWGLISQPTEIRLAYWSFWVIHIAASGMLMLAATPVRPTLLSWVWRYRGQKRLIWDLLVGERSPNVFVGPVFWLMGVAVSAGLVLVNQFLHGGPPVLAEFEIPVAASAGLVMLTAFTFYQLLVLLSGKAGVWSFVFAVVLAIAVPHLGGYALSLRDPAAGMVVYSFAPTVHFFRWHALSSTLLGGDPMPGASPIYFWLLYLFVLGSAAWVLRRQMKYYCRTVDARLATMGVNARLAEAGTIQTALGTVR
jgi:hypothetical protein